MSDKFYGALGLTKPPPAGESVRGEWVNVANFFTALRIVLALPIILLLYYQPRSLPHNVSYNVVAGLIFIAAALTDKADGYFARRGNHVTKVGQFFDPLADKLLMLPVMAVLWYAGMNTQYGSVTLSNISLLKPTSFPLWVLLVVVARELLISVIRFVGAHRGISFPASWSGKVKMFTQIVVVSILIFFPGSSTDVWVQVLLYLMVGITAYSGFDYLIRARKEIFSRPLAEVEE